MIKFARERVELELPARSLSKDLCFALLMSFLYNLKKSPILFYCQIYKLNNCHSACIAWLNRALINCLCQGSPLQHKEKKIVLKIHFLHYLNREKNGKK